MPIVIVYIALIFIGAKEKETHAPVKPPEHCQFFDDRYAPPYKAMCDKWEKENMK